MHGSWYIATDNTSYKSSLINLVTGYRREVGTVYVRVPLRDIFVN